MTFFPALPITCSVHFCTKNPLPLEGFSTELFAPLLTSVWLWLPRLRLAVHNQQCISSGQFWHAMPFACSGPTGNKGDKGDKGDRGNNGANGGLEEPSWGTLSSLH